MLGILSVLGGVGLVCASGVVVSSGLRWFLNYDYDVTAKLKDSKNKKMSIEEGGADHEKHIQNLSRRISVKK